MENLYKELVDKIDAGCKCAVVSYLDKSEKVVEKKILLTTEEIQNISMEDDVREKVILSLETGKIKIHDIGNERVAIIEPFIHKPRLIVYGGGHISKPLTEFAARTGFSVTVIDDRPSFANAGRFPEADEVICESFENAFNRIRFRESDFVVIVTRGHKYDGAVLRKVLKYDLRYIGMIGSKRRVKGMMEELVHEGYEKERLNKVHSPIGLDIGAITPDEIAISIVAQLIDDKNKVTTDENGKKSMMSEFDQNIFEKIYEPSPMPKALITILESKGSVPRKAGAKMITYYDGRTIGSIGGGCSESNVLTKAREIMHVKGFSIEHVDMTGEVAESEGMVCGGVMEVLIEVL